MNRRKTESSEKHRKKVDRFGGMSEEEITKLTLPDHLAHNLDILIVSFFCHKTLFIYHVIIQILTLSLLNDLYVLLEKIV